MASAIPALEARELVEDYRWPAYVERLRVRLTQLEHRTLRENPLDHAALCRALGEIAGIKFALGLPVELSTSDPRSDDA